LKPKKSETLTFSQVYNSSFLFVYFYAVLRVTTFGTFRGDDSTGLEIIAVIGLAGRLVDS